MIMYDASAKNKTQKKIRNEPIENIMFDDSVKIGICWNFNWIYMEFTFIVHLQVDTKSALK